MIISAGILRASPINAYFFQRLLRRQTMIRRTHFLCPGLPDCEEQIADTDGYMNFLEDNPDTESVVVEVERYSYGEGESRNADDDEIAMLEKRGKSFLDSNAVDYLGYDRFIVQIDDEGFSMEEMV